jgi:hypothetical protein
VRSKLVWIGVGGLLALAMETSGCSQHAVAANGVGGGKYCAAFKTDGGSTSGNYAAALSDPAAAFEDCIHRWGYTLAPDRDPADVVAQATVDACGPILNAWNQQTLGQTAGYGQTDRQGRPVPNPQLDQRMRAAASRALFYVVQARAGGCAPPPANTLFTATSVDGKSSS